jgi:Tol biopolymer transport system component
MMFTVAMVAGIMVFTTAVLGQTTWVAEGPPVRVTPEGQRFLQPVFSPAGGQIAVAGPRYQGIYLIDLDAGPPWRLRRLTDAPGAGYRFAWSPDGRAIVTRMARFAERRRFNAVQLFDVATGKSYQLTEERSFMPALPEWSADGRQVVLALPDRVEMLAVPAELEIGQLQRKAARREPAAVALVRDEFRTISAAGEEVRRFKPVPGRYLNAVRSPDGSKVAFEVVGGNLYVMNVDGSGIVDLGRGERPRWSPDGDWLVYMITEDDGHQILASDIYAIRVDGSGKVDLTNTADRIEMNPSWSPDGTAIAYDDHTDGGIYVLRLEQQ